MRCPFVPSPSWSLEGRIALSHAGIAAEVASHSGLHAVLRGTVSTVVSQGIDTNYQQATLSGPGRVAGIGRAHVSGQVESHFVNVINYPDTGAITLTVKGKPGELVLNVTGPHSNLAPRTPANEHLTYTVATASGRFASYAGTQGTAVLTLVTKGPSPVLGYPTPTTSTGSFSLVIRQA